MSASYYFGKKLLWFKSMSEEFDVIFSTELRLINVIHQKWSPLAFWFQTLPYWEAENWQKNGFRSCRYLIFFIFETDFFSQSDLRRHFNHFFGKFSHKWKKTRFHVMVLEVTRSITISLRLTISWRIEKLSEKKKVIITTKSSSFLWLFKVFSSFCVFLVALVAYTHRT